MSSSIKLTNSSGKIVTITNPDTTSADVAVDLLNNAYTIATVDDFGTVPVGYTTVIVKDTDRGGVFNRIASTTANGGTIFDGTTGYSWERQYSGAVNVKWFGAKGDCIHSPTFGVVPTGTDDTQAFKNAISLGVSLFIPSGTYLITDTLSISIPIDIYSDRAILVGYILNTSKAVIEAIGQINRTWENFSIQGTSYVPIGIWFKTADNQAMTLRNVSVVTCRYGMYVNQGEVINRIRIINCTFISNLFAGIYIKSFTSTYAHSAPVFIEDTICNGNGIPSGSWFTNGITYQGIVVWSSSTMLLGGYQMYCKGLANLQVRGGQFSGHNSPKLISLITLENCNGVSMLDFDFEDIQYPVDSSGALIISTNGTNTTNYGVYNGSAINIVAVSDIMVRFKHCFAIRQQCLIKIVYTCRQVTLDIPDDSKIPECTYSVYAFGQGLNNSMINLLNISKKLNDSALVCLNKSYAPLILNLVSKSGSYLRPSSGTNIHFDNAAIDVADNYYQLLYRGATDPFSVGGCYVTKSIRDINAIGVILYANYVGYLVDGRLYVAFYDGSSAYLNSTYIGLNNTDNIGTDNNFVRGMVVQIPSGTRTMKIGFLNGANYTGKIGGGHGNPIGIEVYNLSNSNISSTNLARFICA